MSGGGGGGGQLDRVRRGLQDALAGQVEGGGEPDRETVRRLLLLEGASEGGKTFLEVVKALGLVGKVDGGVVRSGAGDGGVGEMLKELQGRMSQ